MLLFYSNENMQINILLAIVFRYNLAAGKI